MLIPSAFTIGFAIAVALAIYHGEYGLVSVAIAIAMLDYPKP